MTDNPNLRPTYLNMNEELALDLEDEVARLRALLDAREAAAEGKGDPDAYIITVEEAAEARIREDELKKRILELVGPNPRWRHCD